MYGIPFHPLDQSQRRICHFLCLGPELQFGCKPQDVQARICNKQCRINTLNDNKIVTMFDSKEAMRICLENKWDFLCGQLGRKLHISHLPSECYYLLFIIIIVTSFANLCKFRQLNNASSFCFAKGVAKRLTMGTFHYSISSFMFHINMCNCSKSSNKNLFNFMWKKVARKKNYYLPTTGYRFKSLIRYPRIRCISCTFFHFTAF